MHANMPNFFTASNWGNTGDSNSTTLYSILDKRAGFKVGGAFTFRLQIGRSGSSADYKTPEKKTIWKQTNDPATERKNGTGYQFISGEAPTTCGGFNGLYQSDSSYTLLYDADSAEANGCWWMQIVPLIRYQSGNYLDGFGGQNHYHVWQALWVK